MLRRNQPHQQAGEARRHIAVWLPRDRRRLCGPERDGPQDHVAHGRLMRLGLGLSLDVTHPVTEGGGWRVGREAGGLGDSNTDRVWYSAFGTARQSDFGYLGWANLLAGSPYDLNVNGGVGG